MPKKKYPKNKSPKHATIRIPKALADSVEEFLKTDLAKNLGYLYKVDVVTAATRELLLKYGFYKVPAEVTTKPEEVASES